MNRKEFLEKLGITLSASLLIPANILGMNTDELEHKEGEVIIIGAGMAGLACAVELIKNDYDVIVLEGRNRVGGRIWTDRTTGVPLDIGASWIHGPDGKNPITPIAAQANAKTYCTKDNNLVVYDENGKEIPEEKMDKYYNQYNWTLDKNMLKNKK